MFQVNNDGIYYNDQELIFDLYILKKGCRRYGSLKGAIAAISSTDGAAFYVKELCDRAAEKHYKRFGQSLKLAEAHEIGAELTDLERIKHLQLCLVKIFTDCSPESEKSEKSGKECRIEELLIGAVKIGLNLKEAEELTLKELTELVKAYTNTSDNDIDPHYEDGFREIGSGEDLERVIANA